MQHVTGSARAVEATLTMAARAMGPERGCQRPTVEVQASPSRLALGLRQKPYGVGDTLPT
eukprot:7037017-Prorocentrum_lima.AAC.1